MFEVVPVNVQELQKDPPIVLPLNTLDVGTGVYVPADLSHRFQSIRTTVSRYNAANNVALRCTLQEDGRLLVWRDTDENANNGKRQTKVVTVKTRKHEWHEWLIALAIDTPTNIPMSVLDGQGVSWQTLKEWSVEIEARTGCTWYVLPYTTTEVTVTKQRAA